MATTQKKTGKKAGPKRGAPQKRPIRREVTGGVMLALALFMFMSYLGINALFIDLLANLIKGLFGYGYWLSVPALILAGVILIFHHGRPVQLRTSCALLLPMLFGSLTHMIFCREVYAPSFFGVLTKIWSDGIALRSGGAISGVLANGSVAVFSKLASVILFTALFVVALMISLRITWSAVVDFHRSRPAYEEEPEQERPRKSPAIPKAKPARGKRSRMIDIPLDGEEAYEPPEEELEEKERKPVPPPEPISIMPETDSAPPAQEDEAKEAEQEKVPPAAPVLDPSQFTRGGKAETAKQVAEQTAAVAAEIQEKLAAEDGDYLYPPVDLLKENLVENHLEAGAELRNNSRRLAETLTSFGVNAAAGDVIHGPSVTRYEFVLEQGVKLSKITNLADDIALALGASGVRIAPIPDKISVVGIEVPNRQVTPVLIREVIESRNFSSHKSQVAFALGRDIAGENVVGDIGTLPHVLIAGTTGSGKSVCTNSLIISLLYKSRPEEVRFIMVDPKMVELAPYNGIPHLLIPVVTDPKKAAGALQWAVYEMMKRYKTFSEQGVKKLEEYNRLSRTREDLEPMPSIVVVIDELADLMLVAAKEVEESICRVAQMGRAAGMHLVIATQRPSADVITGLMKANIPSRIAFAVASSLESRIILDNTGAEKLVGRGDMLYAPLGAGKPTRVQGCFISPEEIERVVSFVKQTGEAQYDDTVMASIEASLQEKGTKQQGQEQTPADETDELLPAAVEVILETGQASVSMLQRRLKLGYSRAARLVDQMEERGIVGPFEGSKPRQLLITKAQWQEMQMQDKPSGEGEEA